MQSLLKTPIHCRRHNNPTRFWSLLSSWQRTPQIDCINQVWQQHRCYTQKRTARVPQSVPAQSTSKPSRASQQKNSNRASSVAPSTVSNAASASGSSAVDANTASPSQIYASQYLNEAMTGDVSVAAARAKMHGIELWNMKFPTMDLMIPNQLTISAVRSREAEPPSWRIPLLYFGAFRENFNNGWQNFLSMIRLADEYAFPNNPARKKQQTGRWSLQLFKSGSTDETAWIAPMRHDMLDVYKRVCSGIASDDEKLLRWLAAYDFQARALKLGRASSASGKRVWTFHGEASPCKVVSLRTTPAHMGTTPPATGCRLLVQALVKFDTWQSLTTAAASNQSEAHKKRVIEYMVMENRLFHTDGWYIRDQMYEGVRGVFANIGHE